MDRKHGAVMELEDELEDGSDRCRGMSPLALT